MSVLRWDGVSRRLQNLGDEILNGSSIGQDPVSVSPSEGVPRARLVLATVSTSKRLSSGSRIDSRVS